jgi:hypothetical protein
MAWGSLIAGLLIGAATGGWWSRRRAVATAVASAVARSEARALAVVNFGMGPNDAARFASLLGADYDDERSVLDYDHHDDRGADYDDGGRSGRRRNGHSVGRGDAADPAGDRLRRLGIGRPGVHNRQEPLPVTVDRWWHEYDGRGSE